LQNVKQQHSSHLKPTFSFQFHKDNELQDPGSEILYGDIINIPTYCVRNTGYMSTITNMATRAILRLCTTNVT